jgi:hypothetical protein
VENEPRIVLQKKDGTVGQPIPGSLISTTRTSAEDIEEQVNHTACVDRWSIPSLN